MSVEKAVADHYTHGELLGAIEDALTNLGKTTRSVTVEDLAPVDEFHIGGRVATDHLLDQLDFSAEHHILDVGCGLGGAARYVADRFNNSVTGIDLTQEYVEVGNALCEWVGLDDQISLHQGSALAMPFEDESFDGAIMLHVGMNIDDKAQLFTEVYRVLRPGAYFGVYDVMQMSAGALTYPVPWATESSTSKLATPDQYRQALVRSKFKTSDANPRRDFAIKFFRQLRSRTESNGGPDPLGLHTLMQESTAVKFGNMIENIAKDLIAPVEIIAQKS
jgi:ubiquinone/menaquinone biosynthesis C-methylase UbiE